MKTEKKAYILAPEGLTDGMQGYERTGSRSKSRKTACLLSEIPVGTQIHNIELHPGKVRTDGYVRQETARS